MIDTNLKKNFEEFYNRILPYLNKTANGGSGGSGHTIQNNGTDMATQDALNLIGFDVTDNDTDGSTDVSMHELTNAELSEILPSNQSVPYMNGSYALVANRFEKGNMYDTQERIIGKWIDGKPLYQKTIPFTLPANNTKLELGLTNIDNAWLNFQGSFIYNADYGEIIYMNCCWGNSTTGTPFMMHNDSGILKIRFNQVASGWVGLPGYLTVQYTKTTDTVVKVADANDYSTDETIVGTWTDGKPIYQRTITDSLSNTPSASTWGTIYTASWISEIDTLIVGFIHTDGYTYSGCLFRTSTNNLQIHSRISSDPLVSVTIQYTKTTD